MYNFSKTESAKSGSFLKPGVYDMRIQSVDSKEIGDKTVLKITLTTRDKVTLTTDFWITESALKRLQYYHEALLGKRCTQNFKNEESVAEYFKKTFTSKLPAKRYIVSGKLADDGKVYADLAYADFIDIDKKLEVGEFEEDSKEYKQHVIKSGRKNESSNKRNGLLNDDEDDENEFPFNEDEDDENVEKPKKTTKSTGKPTSTKSIKSTKSSKKDEDEEENIEEEEESSEDDLGWDD